MNAVTAAKTDAARPVGVEELKRSPHLLVELSTTDKFSLDPKELAEIQLAGLQLRFRELLGRIPLLQRVAEDQKLTDIRRTEDGALLLLPHTLYKSYPLSAIEGARFDVMTRWLGTLTSIDISGVDASKCECIDEWIDALDAQTPIRVRHSSGTTGKLSFIPNGPQEDRTSAMGFRSYLQGFGDEPDAHVTGVGELPVILFSHRRGAMGSARSGDGLVKYLYGGDESKIIPTNPGRISADLLSLGGRLEGARAKGQRGRMQLSPALLRRREEFAREQAEQPARLREFFERVSALRGQRVILNGILPAVFEVAQEGLRQGYEQLFSPESLWFLVGGAKGRTFPDDYQERIARFAGSPYPPTGYGMTESASSITRMCPKGRYHIQPNIVPYLIDPQSGAPRPRHGVQTGRYGFIDIAAQTRWGGFLTSDEITLDFGDRSACGCGRRGTYIQGDIRRLSDSEGGDDKITCAGAPAVHDHALDFILQNLS
jgi:hypothetical protein